VWMWSGCVGISTSTPSPADSSHRRNRSNSQPWVPPRGVRPFFRCWTRKEAYIKAKGQGLWLPLSQFDVSLEAGVENALLATRPDPSEAAQWSLREVAVGPGYVAALCVAGHGFRVQDWKRAKSWPRQLDYD